MNAYEIGSERAIQDDMYPGMRLCFGCGADNPRGMRIKSFWDGDIAVCTWIPQSRFLAAMDFMNGGITATLIDCHCTCAAMHYLYERDGRPFGSAPEILMVSLQMNFTYKAPVFIDSPVDVRARITDSDGRKVFLECSAYSRGIEAVSSELLFLRSPKISDRVPPPIHGGRI